MATKKNKITKDKKENTSVFKDEATPSFIRRLVANGIIPPRLFMGALVIARNNSFLQKYGIVILALTGMLYILASLFLLLGFEWDNIPFLFKPACALFLLASSCICAKIKGFDTIFGQTAMIFACIFTGALLYLGLNNPVSFIFNWVIFLWWFVIISPWIFLIKKDSLIFFWILVFTVGLILWGVEYALPWGILNCTEFFLSASVLLFVFLGIKEIYTSHYKISFGNLIRFQLLFCSFALALVPIVLYSFDILKEASLSLSAIVFILLFVLSFGIYYVLFQNLKALTLIIFFFCAFCVLLAYINYIKYDALLPSFALIVIPFGFFSWFTFRFRLVEEKGEKR